MTSEYLRPGPSPLSDLELKIAVSLDREAEILEDLQWALAKHGPESEPWKALLKELQKQEARSTELGRQVGLLLDRRQQALS
jgi:hypothetical protein